MNNENFMIEVEAAFLRSKRVLLRKQEEYAGEHDRLEQFYRVGYAQNIEPTQALVSMAMKHVTSIADMSKHPTWHNSKKWRKKLTDLRNYTFLLDALLIDQGVE